MLFDRYRSAGITSIARDFYCGGRHETLHELNHRDVITNLLVWISRALHNQASRPCRRPVKHKQMGGFGDV